MVKLLQENGQGLKFLKDLDITTRKPAAGTAKLQRVTHLKESAVVMSVKVVYSYSASDHPDTSSATKSANKLSAILCFDVCLDMMISCISCLKKYIGDRRTEIYIDIDKHSSYLLFITIELLLNGNKNLSNSQNEEIFDKVHFFITESKRFDTSI